MMISGKLIKCFLIVFCISVVASTTLTADRNRSVVLDSYMSVYLNGNPVLYWITQSQSKNIGWNI